MIVMNQSLDITNSISFKDLQLKNALLQSILIWDKEYAEEKSKLPRKPSFVKRLKCKKYLYNYIQARL